MGQQVLQGQLHTLEFEQIFQLSQGNLKEALVGELKALGYKPKSRKGYLYASGELPIMLIAHMDTVHQHICYSEDGYVMMSPEGIGGDDRAGVYMILRILQEAKCHVLFCEDEEIGGQGARKFERSSIRPEVNYLVELDRHGGNDAVFYNCNNREVSVLGKPGEVSATSPLWPHTLMLPQSISVLATTTNTASMSMCGWIRWKRTFPGFGKSF